VIDHVSLPVADLARAAAFYDAVLATLGLRPQYTMPFYGAFVLDLDGFKIEAVCRR
jgi:catechol 2,3-dioxygenase-like lactoylglutathione lyase family enzyme